MIQTFGRTNAKVPRTWIQPLLGFDVPQFIESHLADDSIIDISGNLGVLGYQLQQTSCRISVQAGRTVEGSDSEEGAYHAMSAEILQVISALGRQKVDFFYWRYHRALEEFQINGAIRALADGKEEGLIDFVGLRLEGHPLVAMSLIRFHDAFETLMLPQAIGDAEALVEDARARRIGIVWYGSLTLSNQLNSEQDAILVPAQSIEESIGTANPNG